MGHLAHGARRAAIAFAATAILGACYEYTGPEPAPDLFLTGTFAWELTGVPGGDADTINISAALGTITGYGVEYRLGDFYSTFSVTGGYSSDTAQWFWLAFRYTNGGWSGSYEGRVSGPDSLIGQVPTYTVPGFFVEVYHRQPMPPCANPAPASTGQTGAPIAIVQLHAGVDVVTEAELLADRYGFIVGSVHQSQDNFTAVVSAATAAVLRCEPSVAAMAYPF